MMSKIKYIVLLLLLTSACSPAQRIERITNRNPQLMEKQTITVRDTVVWPGITISTQRTVRDRDTVRDTINNVKVQIIRISDTIYLNVEVPPDTIPTEADVDVDVVKVYKTQRDPPMWVRISLLLLVFYVVFRFIRWTGKGMDKLKAER